MKERINCLINKITVKKALVITVIFVFMLYLIDYSVIGVAELERITNGGQILDMEHGYSVEKAYEVFDYLGEVGRNFYLTKIIPLDIFFPISFMLFNLSWMCFIMKKATNPDSKARYLVVLPFVDMILDWSENVGFTLMLANYPEKLVTVCNVGSIITRLKFTSILCIIITDIILIVISLFKKVINKK